VRGDAPESGVLPGGGEQIKGEFAKGSQNYRLQQTAKRRARKEKQEERKRIWSGPAPVKESPATTVIFEGHRFRTTKLVEFWGAPGLMWRQFHRWVKSFSGFSKENQGFAFWDDQEAVTLRRCQHPDSPDFNDLRGKTFRLLRRPPRKCKKIGRAHV
jgi:hypothetical protein